MNVLLTASFKNGLFCNGLQQNIVFLAELIANIGAKPIIVIDHKTSECKDPPSGILIIEESEILDYQYDFILQTGFVLEKHIVDKSKKKTQEPKTYTFIMATECLRISSSVNGTT